MGEDSGVQVDFDDPYFTSKGAFAYVELDGDIIQIGLTKKELQLWITKIKQSTK